MSSAAAGKLFATARIALHTSVESPTRELLLSILLSHGATFYPALDTDVAEPFPPETPALPTHLIISQPASLSLLELAASVSPNPHPKANFWIVSASWVDACVTAAELVDENPHGYRVPKSWVVPVKCFAGTRIYFCAPMDPSAVGLQELVIKLGGIDVPSPHDSDFQVARCSGQIQQESAPNPRSLIWLKDSLLHGGPMATSHQPFVYLPAQSLDGVEKLRGAVICVTGLRGNERLCAIRHALLVGARYSPRLLPNTTVLVAKDRCGNKFRHAMKWKIPAVHSSWLEQCVSSWSFLDPAQEKFALHA